MKNRESIGFLTWIGVTILVVALIGGYMSSTGHLSISHAQISPLPTATWTLPPPTNTPPPPTNTPPAPTPTDTPPPPTDTPLPPTPTNTPPPPTPTNTPLPPNQPPVCSDAAPSQAQIWPPDHKFVAIDVLGVTDPDGDPITITIDGIFQDEAVDAPGSGDTSPDGQGVESSMAEVRAERMGDGNGRVYHVFFTADDGNGGTCSGEVLVGVPHDEESTPVEDGPLYDSTVVIP